MTEINLDEIKKRSVSGVIALTSRTAVLQIISFVSTFILTIFLTPEVFGVFFVVSAVVAFLNYFSDIGLAAALIQKQEKVTETDLKTTFTIQQVIVFIIVAVAILSSKKVSNFYNLSIDGLWLFRALIIAFFLSSLKTIPSVIIERKLDFNKLVIAQIIEVILFYSVAIYLAWRGFGIASFSYAVIWRGVGGLITIYMLQPWKPGLTLNTKSAKKLLSFGVPFQLNSILALVKDDLFTLFLGKVLPFTYVGYIGWAKKWSEVPLRLIMDSIIKVTFPTYSRLQKLPEKLSKGINKALFFLSILIFPMGVGLIFLIKPLVYAIPKYLKWEPALISFYLFVIASIIASISSPLTNALNSIGKIKTTLKLMVMWTLLTWGLGPVLIFLIGFNGFALANSLIGATVFVVIWISKKHFKFSLLPNILPAALSSLIMAMFMWLIGGHIKPSLFYILFYILSSGLVYFSSLFFFFKEKTVGEIRKIYAIINIK